MDQTGRGVERDLAEIHERLRRVLPTLLAHMAFQVCPVMMRHPAVALGLHLHLPTSDTGWLEAWTHQPPMQHPQGKSNGARTA